MRQVQDYLFEDEILAEKAYVEEEGINYIKQQIPKDNPQVVLKLYEHLIEEKMFETPVGISFMTQLREYLKSVPEIEENDISLIPITTSLNTNDDKNKQDRLLDRERKNFQREREGWQKKLKSARIGIITLMIMIAGMFAILFSTGKSVTILNYENAIIDKYESWEKELDEREAQLNQREKELENQ